MLVPVNEGSFSAITNTFKSFYARHFKPVVKAQNIFYEMDTIMLPLYLYVVCKGTEHYTG